MSRLTNRSGSHHLMNNSKNIDYDKISRALADRLRTMSSEDFIKAMNNPDDRDCHRKQYNDREWEEQQPKGKPKYKIGDVVEFHAGGFGVIQQVSENDSRPPSYSTRDIEGMPPHAQTKVAWHFEGDFKNWTAKSPLHYLPMKLKHVSTYQKLEWITHL